MAVDEILNSYIDADSNFDGFDEAGPLKKEFIWRTDVVQYDSLVRQTGQISSQPLRRWYLNYSTLTEDCRNKLIELFNRSAGRFQTFKFTDRDDYAATYSECSITAIAGQVNFQLIKTYYPSEPESWSENKTLIVPGATYAPTIKVDAAIKVEGADYTLNDNTGIITFSVAPGAGKVITADYQFYFKVAFNNDVWMDIMNHPGLWDAGHLVIEEVK